MYIMPQRIHSLHLPTRCKNARIESNPPNTPKNKHNTVKASPSLQSRYPNTINDKRGRLPRRPLLLIILPHHPNHLRPPPLHPRILLIPSPPPLLKRRKPLLARAVFLVGLRMRKHTPVHREALVPTHPCGSYGAVYGAFGECCIHTLISLEFGKKR